MEGEKEDRIRQVQSHPNVPLMDIFAKQQDKDNVQQPAELPAKGDEPQVPGVEEEEDDYGEDDTITSLAGAKLLAQYRRAMRRGSEHSTDHPGPRKHQSSPMFTISLERIREDDDIIPLKPKTVETSDVFIPPDGGYGWFVALGAFLSLFWCSGMVKSFGVIFNEILIFFPDSSKSLASWIPACMTSLALAMAPIASMLCQKFNCRLVTIGGAILCFLGMTLSSFAPNLEFLFFTFGILTGIGVGMSTTPGIILTARYFTTKRAKANAFCLSGTAFGSFILPHLIQGLINEFGFRGALLIFGACMLHLLISAALYRPLTVHVKIVKAKKVLPIAAVHHEVLSRQMTPAITIDQTFDESRPGSRLSVISEDEYSSMASSRTSLGPYKKLYSDSDGNLFASVADSLPAVINDQKSPFGSKTRFSFKRTGSSRNTPKRLSSLDISQQTRPASSLSPPTADANSSMGEKKFSFIYSLEDLNTDSTAIFKDTRFEELVPIEQDHLPSRVFAVNRSNSERRPSFFRPQTQRAALDRSISERHPPVSPRFVVPKRQRYISEGHEDEDDDLPNTFLTKLHDQIESSDEEEVEKDSKKQVETKKGRKRFTCMLCAKCFDKTILKQPLFMVMTASVMLVTVGVPHVLFFLPAHAMSIDFDPSTLLSIAAAFDLTGRVGSAFIIDMKIIPLHNFYTVAVLLAGLATLALPFSTNVPALMAATGLYGLGTGTWLLMIPLSLSEYFGVENIATTYGMIRFFQSTANLVGPILGGNLWELTGDLEASFYFLGTAMTVGSLIALAVPWATKLTKEQKKVTLSNA